MKPRTIAVICAYWKSREENIRRIVRDLQNGTTVPDRIIVLNNNRDWNPEEIQGVDIINSQFNSRTRGKYIVGLLDVADYYLLIDDDTSVGKKTLEILLKYAQRDKVFGFYGVTLEGGNGERIYPKAIEKETETEFFGGSAVFCSFYGLVRLLIVEEELRRNTAWKHEGDDILIGLVNKARIIPMHGEEEFEELSWGTEAMSWGSDGITESGQEYLRMRERFTRDAVATIKEKGIPEF